MEKIKLITLSDLGPGVIGSKETNRRFDHYHNLTLEEISFKVNHFLTDKNVKSVLIEKYDDKE